MLNFRLIFICVFGLGLLRLDKFDLHNSNNFSQKHYDRTNMEMSDYKINLTSVFLSKLWPFKKY